MGDVSELAERAWTGDLGNINIHPGRVHVGFEEFDSGLGFMSAFSNVGVVDTDHASRHGRCDRSGGGGRNGSDRRSCSNRSSGSDARNRRRHSNAGGVRSDTGSPSGKHSWSGCALLNGTRS